MSSLSCGDDTLPSGGTEQKNGSKVLASTGTCSTAVSSAPTDDLALPNNGPGDEGWFPKNAFFAKVAQWFADSLHRYFD